MKTFIQNNKRKLLLILAAVLIVCTFSGFMLTASAFTLATGWTVIYRTDCEAIISTTTEDLDTVTAYPVHGSVNEYGIVVNGQVYGNANVASTLTANKLILGTVGEDFNEGSNYEDYAIYYKLSTDTYFTRANTRTITTQSSKKVQIAPVTITEAGTYTICAVQCSYTVDADDVEEYFTRSAFLTVTVNPDFTLPENPTKTGYTFSGWYTDQACTTLFEGDAITSDLVLYAGWTANNYTVHFHFVAGSEERTQSFVYDTAQTLAPNEFEYTGYTFKGWATSTPATSVKYTDEQEVNNLTADADGHVHLYAVWAPTSFTVAFNANGGEGQMTSQVMEYDAPTALSACTFTREGYIFKGWATSADGPVVYDDKAIVKNLASNPNNPVQLYAVWEIIQCNVTFIVDGKVYAVVTVDYGTPAEEVISSAVNAALYNVVEEELPLE